MTPKETNYFFIIVIVIIVFIITSFITNNNLRTWFYTNQVTRSSFTPPGIVFGIVWVMLYIFYAWTWCIAYKKSKDKYYPIFILSIVLNLFWVVAFFGLHNLILSRIIIIALLAVVLYQIYIMNKLKSRTGVAFMSIYALWLVCAALLNFTTHF
jgi:benzodiazapine receptor